jgi:hypothetical protein
MFADANDKVRQVRTSLGGCEPPAVRDPTLGLFHSFLHKKVGTIIIGLYFCKCEQTTYKSKRPLLRKVA